MADVVIKYGQIISGVISENKGNSISVTGEFYGEVKGGGSGPDTVTVEDAHGYFISTGAGNDNIVTKHGSCINGVDVGDGNDTVSFEGGIGEPDAMGHIITGPGNDTVHLNGRLYGDIDAGDGNDNLYIMDDVHKVDGIGGNINSGAGDDKINVYWFSEEDGGPSVVEGDIDAGAGNNTVKIDGTVQGKVSGLAGNDNISVGKTGIIKGGINAGDGNNIYTIDGTVKGGIVGLAGIDNVLVRSVAHVEGGINVGAGKNVIGVYNTVEGGVKSLGDNDKITVGEDGIVMGGINAGDGSNTIIVNGNVSGGIVAGNGNDTLTIKGAKESVVVDDIDLGNGTNSVTVTNASVNSITLGSGKDRILAIGAEVDSIATGAGDDTINLTKVGSVNIDSGEGNDKTTVSSEGVVEIAAGAGADTITVNKGTDVYIDGGDGNDKITVDWNNTKGDVTIVADVKDDKGFAYADTITIKGLKIENAKVSLTEDGSLIITKDNRDLVIKNWVDSTISAIAFADGKKTSSYLNTFAKLESGRAEGSKGNDSITINGKSLSIGKDKYTVPDGDFSAEKPFVVDAIGGNNTFTVTNAENYKLMLGDGNNKVTVDWNNSSNITIVAGTENSGTESITVKNAKFSKFTPSIDAGKLILKSDEGDLVIENFGSGTVKEITFADGKVSSDFIVDISNREFKGTAGADKVTFNKDGSALFGKVGFDATGLELFDTGDGKDTVIINGDVGTAIYTGADADTITVNGGSNLYIDAGEGNDKITVDWNKTAGNVTIVADQDTEYSDTITIKNLRVADTKISVVGDDLVVAEKEGGRKLIIKNWSAETVNAITFADGKKTSSYLNTCANLADGKAEATKGDDGITINGDALIIGKDKYSVSIEKYNAENPFEVDALGGNDTITVTNNGDYKLVLGEGNDKVTVNWTDKHDITIVAGIKEDEEDPETETITVKNAKFSRFTPTINADGSLVLSSVDGSGNLTIENFNSGTVKEITFADGKVSKEFIEGISRGEFIGTEAADKVTLNGTASMFGKVGFDATDLKSIDTKAGNDTVIINSAEDIDVSTGEGNDIVTINDAEGIDVSTGEGNDIVTINDAADVDVFTGVGVDTINVNGGRDLYINGGNDNDKITVDWAKTSGNITLVADKGTTFADVITIKNLKIANADVSIKAGDLVIVDGDRQLVVENWESSGITGITFADGKKTKENIKDLTGVNTVVDINDKNWSASNSNDTVTVNGSRNQINLLAGDDTLIVNGSSNTVNSGSGHNKITVNSSGGNEAINGGTATNEITVSGANDVQIEAGEFLTEQELIDYKAGKLTGAAAAKVESYWKGTLQGDNVTVNNASGQIEIVGSVGNDKYIVSGTGSNSRIDIGDADDGNDYIEISKVGSADIAGGNGNDQYVIDWDTVGQISIRNSNDPWPEPDPWADGETSIKQENDKLVLKNVKSNEVTISWVDGMHFTDHGQVVEKAVRIADINDPSHFVDIAYWDENNMTEIVFDDKTLKAADVNALLDAGGNEDVEENIINIPNISNGSYGDVIVSGTDMVDRFVFGLSSNNYGTIIENYGKGDVIDCSNLLHGLSSDYSIVVSVNRNYYEENDSGRDVLLWYDVRNKETGEPINRNGNVILKNFFANGSVGTVNFNDKLMTIVGDNAVNSWSASYNSEIHFIGSNIKTTINQYNKDTIIDISKAIDYDDGRTWYEKSGNNLVLRIKNEDNDTSSSITFVDYYVNDVKPRLRLYGYYSSVLTVGTDGVDNVNLNKLFNAKEDGGIVYFAGSGNDVITADKGNIFVFAGAGNDTVTVNNDGNDVCVEGTSGQNTISISGAGDVDVVAGAGTGDTINVTNSEYAYILGAAGNDKIVMKDVSHGNVEAGAGDDTIYVCQGQNEQYVCGDAGNDTYVVQYNRAEGVYIDQTSAARGDKDKLVILGVDTTNLDDINVELEYEGLMISGSAARWSNDFTGGEYSFQEGINIFITIEGWLDSELKSIELVDIDNNRTLTYSGNAITEAVQNAMTSFKDIAVDPSTNTIGATEQEQLNILKLYSNTSDPNKTCL